MTVIIAEKTPDKVRGLLKRWFLEPKPNVFVGTVNRRTRGKILTYILKYAPEDLALLVISEDGGSQGFMVEHYRDPAKRAVKMNGLYLVEAPPEGEIVVGISDPPGIEPEDSGGLPAFHPSDLNADEIITKSLITYRPKN